MITTKFIKNDKVVYEKSYRNNAKTVGKLPGQDIVKAASKMKSIDYDRITVYDDRVKNAFYYDKKSDKYSSMF